MKKTKRILLITLITLLGVTGCSKDKWGAVDPGEEPSTINPLDKGELVQDEETAKENEMDEQVVLTKLNNEGDITEKDFTFIATEDYNPQYLINKMVSLHTVADLPVPEATETEDGKNLMLVFSSPDPFLPFFLSSGLYDDIIKQYDRGVQRTPLEHQRLFYSLYDETVKDNFPKYEKVIFFNRMELESELSPGKDGVVFPD